jgi:hypothetical protein
MALMSIYLRYLTKPRPNNRAFQEKKESPTIMKIINSYNIHKKNSTLWFNKKSDNKKLRSIKEIKL